MTFFPIRLLGLLHGSIGLVTFLMAASLPSRPEANSMPRVKLYYVVSKLAISGLALVACLVAAWLRPTIAWVFALLSLLSYAPGPTWAKLCISSGYYRVVPPNTVSSNGIPLGRNAVIGLTLRVALVCLIAVAGNPRCG
jgi:hypothetical protein